MNNDYEQGGCRTKLNSSAQSLEHELHLLYEENHGHQQLLLNPKEKHMSCHNCRIYFLVLTDPFLWLTSSCALQTFEDVRAKNFYNTDFFNNLATVR